MEWWQILLVVVGVLIGYLAIGWYITSKYDVWRVRRLMAKLVAWGRDDGSMVFGIIVIVPLTWAAWPAQLWDLWRNKS